MKPRVYIETTVVSYLTALPSRDLLVAAHQQVTQSWWSRRDRFELFVSQAVLREARQGDAGFAARRLTALQGIRVLRLTSEAGALAKRLVEQSALPEKAAADAIHISVAVVNGMDFLLTWNCTHIANAATRGRIDRICREAGFEPTVICTPEELDEE